MSDIVSILKSHNISLLPVWNSGFQRQGSEWMKAIQIESGDQKISIVHYGDFAKGTSHKWQSVGNDAITPEQRVELEKKVEEYETERLRQLEKLHTDTADQLASDYAALGELVGDAHPYLRRKNVGAYGGLREMREIGAIAVPIRDTAGKLWNVQRILSDKIKLERTGDLVDKFFTPGARIDGCFHQLTGAKYYEDENTSRSPAILYVAEGYATGASIYEALGKNETVIVAFNSQNLPKVGGVLREKYKDARLIFCADNDQWKPEKGNTGVRKAQEAAALVQGEVIVPYFPAEFCESKPTDFNDMHALMGLEVVKQQIEGTYDPENKPIQALTPGTTAAGKAKAPSELAVVRGILDHFEGRIICQGRDFFIYRDGVWLHLGRNGEKFMKQVIGQFLGQYKTSKEISGAYNLLLTECPGPPPNVDMFRPEFYKINFMNGTLHAVIKPGQRVSLQFRDHDPKDYLLNKIALPYTPDKKSENNMWIDFLNRVFADDIDKEPKIRVIKQLFGASLLPCYSKIFMFVGPPASGKSTILKVLARLVGEQNISRVQPSDFEGFNMLTMLGKTVNMDTDINTKKPIADDVVKKIVDRVPFCVKRKFQDDVYTPLPPIHVFGGNDMPKSFDGETSAYSRRIIVIKTGSMQLTEQDSANDFAEQMWDHSPEGLLNFALDGLRDILELKGKFTIPESSAAKIKRWNMQSDIVGQFVEDLGSGQIDDTNNVLGLKELETENRIERKTFYELFKDWFKASHPSGRCPGKITFFDSVRTKGFKEKAINGVDFFIGTSITPSHDSII